MKKVHKQKVAAEIARAEWRADLCEYAGNLDEARRWNNEANALRDFLIAMNGTRAGSAKAEAATAKLREFRRTTREAGVRVAVVDNFPEPSEDELVGELR